jgi:hypothetical protein
MPMPLDDEPHPRLLIVAPEGEPDIVELFYPALSAAVGSVHAVTFDELVNLVRLEDWDAVIAWDCNVSAVPGVRVVNFFSGSLHVNEAVDTAEFTIADNGGSVARRMLVSEGQDPRLKALAEKGLLSVVFDRYGDHGFIRTPSPVIACHRAQWHSGGPQWSVKDVFFPFVEDADGKVLGGRFSCAGVDNWFVPEYVKDPLKWVLLALEIWQDEDPERFPVTQWKEQPAWQSGAEQSIAQELEVAHSQFEEQQRAHEQRVDALRQASAEAARSADLGVRRLLTEQGSALVEAVAVSLRTFGFEVLDADTETAKLGDLLEDLRVRAGEWIGLVEVRGYGRGAQLNDLLRIGRFRGRYQEVHQGRPPSAVWYVVNQERQRDPNTRQKPLASNDSEVRSFAEMDGLVIDTRDLFRLTVDVEGGSRTTEEVRLLLINARGRLDLK